MKEKSTEKTKTVGGEHTEIALELHMRENRWVLIMQFVKAW